MTDDECECACHVGGAYRPACDVPGGCHPNHRPHVPSGPICPGPCNKRYRSAAVHEVETGEVNELRPHLGRPVWCTHREDKDGADISCTANIKRALGGMLELYVHLHLSKAVSTADKHDRHGTGDAPSTSREVDDQDETARWLWEWENTIREIRDGQQLDPQDMYPPFPTSRSWEHTIADSVTYLTKHFDWTMTKLDADLVENFGNDMLDEHRRLTRTTKSGAALQHRSAPCPRCERRTLVHEAGTLHIACTNQDCGRLMTLDEYDHMVIALAGSKASA